MSEHTLKGALEDYLALRRSLGFKLVRDGLLLEQFVVFCEQADARRVTSEQALAWVTLPAKASPSWLSMRLSVVRGFASYLQAIDPATEVPPVGWLPARRRSSPYLYSDTDIAELMAAARQLRWPLSAATYETLIGLLAVTGLRIGEAIRLDRTDVSFEEGLLTILESKFGKARLVPIDPSTVMALCRYVQRRDALSPTPNEPSFFVHPTGNRLNYPSVQSMFHTLVRRAGLTSHPACREPRLHDLRHSFAMTTLLQWYRKGVDVHSQLPLLSTWLGHTDPKWTYWYFSASPELLTFAAKRLEASVGNML
jgi:integrase/recombinase XerD